MIHQGYAGGHGREGEAWRASAAGICADVGAVMVGLGLLYWGLMLVHALCLASGCAARVDNTDPLAALGDPFMWAIWVVYWSAAIGLVRRGRRERRR